MKLFARTAIYISFLLCVAACKKDNKHFIRIEGFDLFDPSGVPIGHVGAADNDWTFNNTLSQDELDLFDFLPSDVNFNNTVEATIAGNRINPYPNPVNFLQGYSMNASDSVVMKVVWVNSHLEVLTRTALKFKGSKGFQVNLSDRSIYRNNAEIRMYFSFSALNKPNFKAGYGDVKICDNPDNCHF